MNFQNNDNTNDNTQSFSMLAKGSLVSHYKIIEKLGSGGMGEVYKALDTKLQRTIALKFLSSQLTCDAGAQSRFKLEAIAASSLNHANITTIYEIDEVDDRCFISMEYVDGKSLKELIKEKGFSIEKVVDIATQICEGLNAAHKKDIIHRDIKSDNIMITDDGVVKIVDFGLAKLKGVTRLTKAGSTLGTLLYMSPEQALGKEVDNRSDIYSLGVILYEMITGRLPFQGEFDAAIFNSIINDTPEPMARYKADVPDGFQRIVDKALEKDQEMRYQHVDDLLADLRKLKGGLGSDSSAASLPSIAVLPFTDMSAQKDQEYFCDGISEEIINALARIKSLHVVARTSAFSFKGKDIDIREIGRKLNVSTLLEGSVRKAGNRLRITAQLINVSDGYHIWSESYEREMEDIFDIQSGIAKNIAVVLEVKLSPQEKERLEKKPTDNLTAYDYCIKGREYYYRYRKQDNENAIKLFKKALEFDPNYGQAYAGLADAYVMRANTFGFVYKWIDSAIEVSQKAISIDPNCADAYKSLGSALTNNGLHKKAIESYHITIDLNPNHFPATVNIGFAYSFIGQYDKALLWLKKAVALNPTFAFANAGVGWIYMLLGDYSKAELWVNKVMELEPDFNFLYRVLIEMHLAQGKYDQARTYGLKTLSIAPDDTIALYNAGQVELFSGNYAQAKQYYQKVMETQPLQVIEVTLSARLAYIFWKTDQQDKSKQMSNQCLVLAQRLLEEGRENWDIPYDIATICAIDGNKAESYLWLQKAVDAGWRNYRDGLLDPLLENLRDDDQFKKMMSEVKVLVDDMRKRVDQNDW